jgi:hypothetical protein
MKTLLTVIIMLVACAAAAQDSKPKRAYDPQGQIIDSPNYSKLRDTMIVVRWVERDGRAYNDNNGAAYSSERDQKFFHALRLCRERGHAYGIPSLHLASFADEPLVADSPKASYQIFILDAAETVTRCDRCGLEFFSEIRRCRYRVIWRKPE